VITIDPPAGTSVSADQVNAIESRAELAATVFGVTLSSDVCTACNPVNFPPPPRDFQRMSRSDFARTTTLAVDIDTGRAAVLVEHENVVS
jgi:hypothetical protein